MSPNLIEPPPAQEQEPPQDAAPEPPRLERDEPVEQLEPEHNDVQERNGTSHQNGAPKARTNGHKASAEVWRVLLLPVDKIAPCPYQPRLMFDPVEMAELKESVKAHGVQQPILVRPAKAAATAAETNGDKRNVKTAAPLPYELVAGERRLRASRAAGKKRIPAIVRQLDDHTAAEIALTENVQRSNLSPVEEARGYKQLMLKFRMSEERIAKKVGKSVATIQSTMKLLALPSEVQDLLAKRQLTASHGHALLPLAPHEKVCLSVAQHAVANNLTASALSQTPLPNMRELVQKKLVQELDFRTKFDFRSQCPRCPFKAYGQNGYTHYCLNPPEWHKKQIAAMEQQKSEAAQAMQRVREEVAAQEETRQVDVTYLPAGSYRDLSRVELPAGCCEACPCRREVAAPHDPNEPDQAEQPGKTVPICLDPERFKSLREAERQANEEQRRRHYLQQWNQAISVLQDEAEREGPRKAAVLLTGLVLRNELYRGGPDEGAMLPRSVALNLGIALPWSELLDAHNDEVTLKLLEGTLHKDAEADSTRIHREETDDERAVVSTISTETEQVLEAPNPNELLHPNELLLFAASLLLAREAQQAVKWTQATPRLDFVLGPQGAQGELDVVEDLDVTESEATLAPTAAWLDAEDEEWPDDEQLENERMEDDCPEE